MGAYVPELKYNEVTALVGLIENIEQWVKEYPSKILLCQIEESQIQVLKLSSNFACQFTTIRRAFHLNKADSFQENL